MFLLSRDWSKHVRWPYIPPLKQGKVTFENVCTVDTKRQVFIKKNVQVQYVCHCCLFLIFDSRVVCNGNKWVESNSVGNHTSDNKIVWFFSTELIICKLATVERFGSWRFEVQPFVVARNVSFRISLQLSIYIINSFDKTKLSCNTPTDPAP